MLPTCAGRNRLPRSTQHPADRLVRAPGLQPKCTAKLPLPKRPTWSWRPAHSLRCPRLQSSHGGPSSPRRLSCDFRCFDERLAIQQSAFDCSAVRLAAARLCTPPRPALILAFASAQVPRKQVVRAQGLAQRLLLDGPDGLRRHRLGHHHLRALGAPRPPPDPDGFRQASRPGRLQMRPGRFATSPWTSPSPRTLSLLLPRTPIRPSSG